MANSYVEVAIETCVPILLRLFVLTRSPRAYARIEVADPKVELSLHALEVVNAVDDICHLWQRYMNMTVFPLASSITARREMSVFINQTMSRIEGVANNLLQRLTDGKKYQLYTP